MTEMTIEGDAGLQVDGWLSGQAEPGAVRRIQTP
jgi:hypothetical protein